MEILQLLLLFAFSSCSVSAEDEPKIVGGTDVDIKDFPYQAILLYRGLAFCGASIIGQYWILTAAHCFVELPKLDYKTVNIRVGSSDYSRGGQLLKPIELRVHHSYDSNTLNNDIALIRVKKLIRKGVPVKLAKTELASGKAVWVTGWGSTGSKSSGARKLQGVAVKTVERKTCAKQYSDYRILITPEMICASAIGKDACQGDSGGPMAAEGVQYGIVSYGIGCGDKGHPGVYTNLASPGIIKFINNVTGI